MQGNIAVVLLSAIAYVSFDWLNTLVFGGLPPDARHWFSLPAGMRLVLVLIAQGAGAAGIVLGALAEAVAARALTDPLTVAGDILLCGLTPYLVLRIQMRWTGLGESLANLSPRGLLLLALMFSLSAAVLHQLWLGLRGIPVTGNVRSAVQVAIGDFIGSIFMLYTLKSVLSRWPKPGSAAS